MNDIPDRFVWKVQESTAKCGLCLKLKQQKKIEHARILVIGAGGLGTPVVLYLVGSGIGSSFAYCRYIGHLTIIDDDIVELSNIHRQVAHTEKSAKDHIPKANFVLFNNIQAESLRCRALELNSSLECVAIVERFTKENAPKLIADHDFIVDCCDNIETRYTINDECVRQGKCFVSGATQRFSGQVEFCTICNKGHRLWSQPGPLLSLSVPYNPRNSRQ